MQSLLIPQRALRLLKCSLSLALSPIWWYHYGAFVSLKIGEKYTCEPTWACDILVTVDRQRGKALRNLRPKIRSSAIKVFHFVFISYVGQFLFNVSMLCSRKLERVFLPPSLKAPIVCFPFGSRLARLSRGDDLYSLSVVSSFPSASAHNPEFHVDRTWSSCFALTRFAVAEYCLTTGTFSQQIDLSALGLYKQ